VCVVLNQPAAGAAKFGYDKKSMVDQVLQKWKDVVQRDCATQGGFVHDL